MFSMIMNYILLHSRCKLLWQTICNLVLVSYVWGHKGFTGSTLKSQGFLTHPCNPRRCEDVKATPKEICPDALHQKNISSGTSGKQEKSNTEVCSLQQRAERYPQGQEETRLKMGKAIQNRIIDKDRNKNLQG